ncbi:MAG: DUF1549 domain-containing protein [Pirellula sp.]
MIRPCVSLILLVILPLQSIANESIDFDFDVLPVLTRAGCNAGSCHGAAVGRGGFHLSLWGSDPASDYAAITREFEGRRIDVRRPTESLLLKKPTGTIDHEGGAILDENSASFKIVHTWLQQGARRIRGRELEKIEVRFKHATLAPNSAAKLSVQESGTLDALAYFRGQDPISVNHLVSINIPDSSGLEIDLDSLRLTALRPGIHTLTLRYGDRVQALQVLTPNLSNNNATAESVLPTDLIHIARGQIDRWLDERRAQLSEKVAPLADEATLLRRLMLDLIGRAPSPTELEAYLQNNSNDKYAQQVEQWLGSKEYVDFWTYRWTRTFGLRPNSQAPQGLHHFYRWFHQQLATGRPWDEVCRELITASGDCHVEGPAFFMLIANDPRQQAEQISRLFIGARLECANCHDHPLDRWKQDDYHSLAAVFARVDRKQTVSWLDRGAVTNPRTGLPAIPQLPGGQRFSSSGDVRRELADWMIQHPDSLLAKATVNRLWSHFFGRGLVEPVDDMRLTNPATHPQLLQSLSASFIAQRYDIRALIREIMLSEAYRRESPTTTSASRSDFTYSFGPRKPLSPDVLLDLVDDATGSTLPIAERTEIERAILLEDPTTPSLALDTLGRCVRNEICSTSSATSSLALMLHWINGETVNQRIVHKQHWLKTTIKEDIESEELLKLMTLRTLCRYPTPAEQHKLLQVLNQLPPEQREAGWEDLFWALLSSEDFLDNR